MSAEVRALVDDDGLLGQGLVLTDAVLASLHVLDRALPFTITTMDAHGRRRALALVTRIARDPAADLVVLGTGTAAVGAEALPTPHAPASGTAVDIVAVVVPESRRATARRVVLPSTVVQVVSAAAHRYHAASGQLVDAGPVTACFLANRVPPGWSGAAVHVRATGALLGLVHGNVAANGHRAVCLLPSAASPVLAPRTARAEAAP